MNKFREEDTLGKIKTDSITSSIKIRSIEPVPTCRGLIRSLRRKKFTGSRQRIEQTEKMVCRYQVRLVFSGRTQLSQRVCLSGSSGKTKWSVNGISISIRGAHCSSGERASWRSKSHPNWKPLEAKLAPKHCAEFMWMYRENGIEYYKHIMTRRYLRLDSPGSAWSKPQKDGRRSPLNRNGSASADAREERRGCRRAAERAPPR